MFVLHVETSLFVVCGTCRLKQKLTQTHVVQNPNYQKTQQKQKLTRELSTFYHTKIAN